MPKRGRGRKSRRVDEAKKVTQRKTNSDSDKPGSSKRAVPGTRPAKTTEAREEKNLQTGDQFSCVDTQGALTNHLILKEIFKHLAVHDLLNFSLVNHFWNSCARTVLRENKKCVAFIRSEHMCLDLKELNDLLANSVNIPFNGLSIQRSNDSDSECLQYHIRRILKNPSAFYSNLFVMLTFKYFDIKPWDKNWRQDGQCPGQIIMREIFKNSADKLEGLSIPGVTGHLVSHTLGLSEDEFYFPKLKSLELPATGSSIYRTKDYSYIGRQLLQAAPNVKNLTGGVSPLLLELLREQNKFDAVREFSFEFQRYLLLEERGDPEYSDSDSDSDSEDDDDRKKYKKKYGFEQILQLSHDCVNSLQNLTKLSISTIHFQEWLTENKERWFPVISKIYTGLLSNSSDTLQELRVYQLDLVLLSRLKLPPLPRVLRIELIYVPNLSWTLTKFNCSKLFPNATSVTITCEEDGRHSNSEEEGGDFYITEQMYYSKSLGNESYTWSSVTDLTYGDSNSSLLFNSNRDYCFDHRLPKVFPNVTSVTVRGHYRFATACRRLWTAWPEVVSIAFLHVPLGIICKCYDSCFTGMTQDQCSIVRAAISDGKDVSDLIGKYKTRPSLRNLTKLKSFRVTFFHNDEVACSGEFDPNSKNSGPFLMTEVTKKCALDFMPSLNFEIHGNTCKISGKQCGYTFKHLEPLEPNVKLFIT